MGFFRSLFGFKREVVIVNKIESIDSVLNHPDGINFLTEEEKERIIQRLAIELNNKSNKPIVYNKISSIVKNAAELIVLHQQGSTSLIQRKLHIGYNQAGEIMNILEGANIIGPFLGPKPREVLVKDVLSMHILLEDIGRPATHKNDPFYRLAFADEIRLMAEKNQLVEAEIKISAEKLELKKEILDRARKKKIQRDLYKELQESGEIEVETISKEGRERIPQEVMDKVWNRDGGKCIRCGSRELLEFDHIIPFSKGGAATYRNIQILCKGCNIQKSNKIG